MLSKIKTISWYLAQPKGLTMILQLLKRKTTYSEKENTRAASAAWCSQQAVDNKTALQQLFPGHSSALQDIEQLFPGEFAYADQKQDSSPYKMGGRGNIDLLYYVCEALQAQYVLETGVAYGWSSLAILLSLAKRANSRLVSTDLPYAKMGNDDFVGVVVPPNLHPYWHLIREADVSGLPKAFQLVPHLDAVHYDSDKSYLGRITSYPKLYGKLRRGGVFVSDDIQDNFAFKHFCEKINVTPIVISFQHQFVGAFIKP